MSDFNILILLGNMIDVEANLKQVKNVHVDLIDVEANLKQVENVHTDLIQVIAEEATERHLDSVTDTDA
jgi:hypothetical protein